MKELQMFYHNVTGQIMLRDKYNERETYKFRDISDVSKHFNEDSFGKKIRDRGRVKITVDITKVVEDALRKDIKKTLSNIHWGKKTEIVYERIPEFYT
jgi:hypothetical protein